MGLTLLERVGAGAHGEVWRASWGGRTVAAKVMDARDAVDEQAALEDAARLRAMGIDTFVELVDVTQVDARWALVLEWIDGATVRQTLETSGVASSAAVRSLLHSASAALAAAWKGSGEPLRLIHRDLHPSNLMIQEDGRLRIADLGLATRWMRPGCHVDGTPGYVAPERYLGEEGVAGDVYGLGCVATEMLTGRRFGPPAGHSRGHQRKIRSVVADLREADVDASLIEVLVSMLAFDPDERPSHEAVVAACPFVRGSLLAWRQTGRWSRGRSNWDGFRIWAATCA